MLLQEHAQLCQDLQAAKQATHEAGMVRHTAGSPAQHLLCSTLIFQLIQERDSCRKHLQAARDAASAAQSVRHATSALSARMMTRHLTLVLAGA